MKVIICGDRHWDDVEPIRELLHRLPKGTTIIHGGAKGADTLAGAEASKLHFEVIEYPAEWGRYGRGAGPIRNQQMLDQLDPHTDRVYAFHPDLSESKGTKDMVRRAIAKSVEVVLYPEPS